MFHIVWWFLSVGSIHVRKSKHWIWFSMFSYLAIILQVKIKEYRLNTLLFSSIKDRRKHCNIFFSSSGFRSIYIHFWSQRSKKHIFTEFIFVRIYPCVSSIYRRKVYRAMYIIEPFFICRFMAMESRFQFNLVIFWRKQMFY